MPNEFKITTHGTTVLENFSWVGAGSIVLPNIVMAEGSVLGAGALLTKNTEPWTVYIGSPAKPYKARNKKQILENARKLGYEY
jgi:acetyltransferase-like isoleucine patch superfamily enzyme